MIQINECTIYKFPPRTFSLSLSLYLLNEAYIANNLDPRLVFALILMLAMPKCHRCEAVLHNMLSRKALKEQNLADDSMYVYVQWRESIVLFNDWI